MLDRLVSTVYTYLNAGSYYKDALEIQNAINMASLDLYKRLRGNLAQYAPGRPTAAINPGQTNVTSDALSELYKVYDYSGLFGSPLEIKNTDGRSIDIIESIEVAYDYGDYYPVNIVPDNQFLMMKNNPVIPPIKQRPLGRLVGFVASGNNNWLNYEIIPNYPNFFSYARVRCLTLPSPVVFTLTDNGGPIPTVTFQKDIDWTEDKLDNLVYGTVANLGFNLSNGVLVQSGEGMNQKTL
jgi:hypothetical protein